MLRTPQTSDYEGTRAEGSHPFDTTDRPDFFRTVRDRLTATLSDTGLPALLRFRNNVPLRAAPVPRETDRSRDALYSAIRLSDLHQGRLSTLVGRLSDLWFEAGRRNAGALVCLTQPERDELAGCLAALQKQFADASTPSTDPTVNDRAALHTYLSNTHESAAGSSSAKPRWEFADPKKIHSQKLVAAFNGLIHLGPLLEALNLSESPVGKSLIAAAESVVTEDGYRPMVWLELSDEERENLLIALRCSRETAIRCNLDNLPWRPFLAFLANLLHHTKARHIQGPRPPRGQRPAGSLQKGRFADQQLRQVVPILYCLGRQLKLGGTPLPLAVHQLELQAGSLQQQPRYSLYNREQLQLAKNTLRLFYRQEITKRLEAEDVWPSDLAGLFVWVRLMRAHIPGRHLKRALM